MQKGGFLLKKAEQKTAFHLQLWSFLPVLLLSVLHSVVAWSYQTVTFDLGKYWDYLESAYCCPSGSVQELINSSWLSSLLLENCAKKNCSSIKRSNKVLEKQPPFSRLNKVFFCPRANFQMSKMGSLLLSVFVSSQEKNYQEIFTELILQ